MKAIPILAAFAVLTGCGGVADEPAAARPDPAERDTVFDPLTGTLDRVEGVEDTLRESADARRRQLEEAE
jgi:hypothetical protein